MKPILTSILVLTISFSILQPSGMAQVTDRDFFKRGLSRAAKGDLDGAIFDFTHVLQLNPNIAAAYYNRGTAKKGKGDLDGALADYNRALELDPKNEDAYCNRGSIKQVKGDLDGAVADLSHALILKPNDESASNNRGFAEQTKGDFAAALADYNRALALKPGFTIAMANRAHTRQATGDLDGAVADYSHLLELNPRNGDAYFERGVTQALKHNCLAAISDFRRQCEVSPGKQDYAHLFIWLARVPLGQKAAADQELATYFATRRNTVASAWASKVAGHLLGQASEADLCAAAKSPNAALERNQLCEAWFYVGMKKLLTGDRSGGGDDFQKCVATGQEGFVEYQCAKAELRELAH